MKVYGEGKKESKIWLIGEAPGAKEEATGRPFVGGAGTVLEGILQDAQIARSETYIDNIIQDRPPKNDFSIYYEDKGRKKPKQSLLDAHERIRREVSSHKPNVVVALGGEASYALTGERKIMHWRGSILNYNGVKVIPTVHPAAVMRMYELRPISVLDFKRIKEESKTPSMPNAYNDKFIINPTYSQVMEYIDLLHRQEYIAFDIETAYGQITCIGFAWSKEDAICIPIGFSTSSWWTEEEEQHIVLRLRKLFLSPNIKFIAQNAQYDMIWLADKWGIEVVNLWLDTMIGFHCVYPELKKSLAFLSSIYTTRPYYKSMAEKGNPDLLWKYNCFDTVVTWEVAHAIKRELEEFNTWDFYASQSHKLIKPLITMQRKGVLIDAKKREEIDTNLEKELTEMQERLDRVVGHELNVNSPKQMKEFLYTELKLPPQIDKKTKAMTADEEAIETLAKKFPNPVFDIILDIRGCRKLLSTYIRAPLDDDGRIRCNYVITGTETGRLASRKSVYGSGTNLQNIPRGQLIRSIFITDTAKQFVNIDLSQAEARVVAFLARERMLQALFKRKDGDIHRHNAAMVFSKRIEEVTKDERQLAKSLIHASNYGIGPRTFSKVIGSTENRARELLNQYYALYPRIKIWHREVDEEVKKKRILTTPLGRKRMFFGRWGSEMLRDAYAYVPQSTVGDILNWGIIRCFPNLPQDWELMLQNHDSVLIQVPIGADRMHIYKFAKHYFEIPIVINRETLVIPVDIEIGLNWGELKKMEV